MDIRGVSGESFSVNRSDKVIKGQAFLQKQLSKEARVGAVKSLVEDAKTACNAVTSRMEHAQQWYGGNAIEMCQKQPKSALIVGGILTVTGLGLMTTGTTTMGAASTAAGAVVGSVILTANSEDALKRQEGYELIMPEINKIILDQTHS